MSNWCRPAVLIVVCLAAAGGAAAQAPAPLPPVEDPPQAVGTPPLATDTTAMTPTLVAGVGGLAADDGLPPAVDIQEPGRSGRGASGGLPERVVALAESIQSLPESERERLHPFLQAVVQAELQRHVNWAAWDTYRVAQWRNVFEQSHSFSWWVFIVAHLVLLAALVMSYWEFARAGAFARHKEQEAAARRAERQTTLAQLTALAPDAQTAGVTALLNKVEEQARQETELEISANKLVMRTSIMGFVMMSFALAFYALFILYVYPVQQTGTVGGRLPGASSAPTAVRSAN